MVLSCIWHLVRSVRSACHNGNDVSGLSDAKYIFPFVPPAFARNGQLNVSKSLELLCKPLLPFSLPPYSSLLLLVIHLQQLRTPFYHQPRLLISHLWPPPQMQCQNRHPHSKHRVDQADDDEAEERRSGDLGDRPRPAEAPLDVVVEIEDPRTRRAMPRLAERSPPWFLATEFVVRPRRRGMRLGIGGTGRNLPGAGACTMDAFLGGS